MSFKTFSEEEKTKFINLAIRLAGANKKGFKGNLSSFTKDILECAETLKEYMKDSTPANT